MNKNFRRSLPGLALLWVGVGGATDFAELGRYNTSLPDDQLFQDANGRVLQRDLSFSVPGRETVVAPQGSEIEQTLPPSVWQYSALLPVASYLKTAAIHSVSSDKQTQSWQDVQLNFYNGLLVEGANIVDAQIAYAGAYAFAPRWSLVELIKVTEAQTVYPESVLYRVKASKATESGFTLEEYRALSLKILQQPEDISLEEIKAIVDSRERSNTGQIASLDATNVNDNSADIQVDTATADESESSGADAGASATAQVATAAGAAAAAAVVVNGAGEAADQLAKGEAGSGDDSGVSAAQAGAAAAAAGAVGAIAADKLAEGEKRSAGGTAAKIGTSSTSALAGSTAQTGAVAAAAGAVAGAAGAGDEAAKQDGSKEDDKKDDDESDDEKEGDDEESGDDKDSKSDDKGSDEKKAAAGAAASATASAAASAAGAAASAAGTAAATGAAAAAILPQRPSGSNAGNASAESSDQAAKVQTSGNVTAAPRAQAPSGTATTVTRTTATGFIPAPILGGRAIPLTPENLNPEGTEQPTSVFGAEVFDTQDSDVLTSPVPSGQVQPSGGVKLQLDELFFDDSKPQDANEPVSTDSESADDSVTGNSPVDASQIQGAEDEWVVLPDGSLVLRSTGRLSEEE